MFRFENLELKVNLVCSVTTTAHLLFAFSAILMDFRREFPVISSLFLYSYAAPAPETLGHDLAEVNLSGVCNPHAFHM